MNAQVSESACAAMAILSGVKVNRRTVGVDARVSRRDCARSVDPDTHLETIVERAQRAGRATGMVTTARVTSSTLSAGYARAASSSWENDQVADEDGADAALCPDVALQLVHGDVGRHLQVWHTFHSRYVVRLP